MNNSVQIAVSQANVEPWNSIWKEGQEKTWLKEKVNGSSVIHYQSIHASFFFNKFDEIHEKNRYRKNLGLWQGRIDKILARLIPRKIPNYTFERNTQILTVNSRSMYLLQGRRIIGLYDWFLDNTTRDFLFMTNTSSYIKQRNLLKLVQELNPNDAIYAGYLLPEGEAKQFVSGAGKLLSRKSVELVRDNWKMYNHEALEDVALGVLMEKLGIPATPLSRVSLSTPEHVSEIQKDVIEREFHFRCKSQDIPRKDVEIMRLLHQKVTELD
jgi:hypothetical protein